MRWRCSPLSLEALLQVERCQELVRNWPPPVGIKPQQVAVTGNTVDQFEARAAAGCDERLIIAADPRLVVEAVVVCIKPKLRDLVRRAAASLREVRRGDRCIRVPAAGEAHHAHDLAGFET